MRLACYMGQGRVAIVDEPVPACPDGGLLIKTEASGLCSGELMDWYMDRKIPHVLGHEVSGRVVESQDHRFPVGSRLFVHHHAPCMACEECGRGAFVHCKQWKATKLVPGGMAETFAVSRENLTDTFDVGATPAKDAALIEPLACTVKCLRLLGWPEGEGTAVVGLGAMGLLHMLQLPGAVGYDLDPVRINWAKRAGLEAREPDDATFETVVVCPGSKQALQWGLDHVKPQGKIALFAPLPPGSKFELDLEALYFKDLGFVTSYSCGPDDTRAAFELIQSGKVRADQVVSNFIKLEELPDAYLSMKKGRMLKAMVLFD